MMFWKIKADKNLLEYFKYLKIDDEYIKILLDKDCKPYLYYSSNEYFFVCCQIKKHKYQQDNVEWGWDENKHYSWFIENGYVYQGEINSSIIRKKKLKNLCCISQS